MDININTTERLFYRQALELLRGFPPLKGCANRELDVLAELLYYNDYYKDLPTDVRNKMIFDYDTRIAIGDYLNMDGYTLRNMLTQLRKKDLIGQKDIKFKMFVPSKDGYSINFIFHTTK